MIKSNDHSVFDLCYIVTGYDFYDRKLCFSDEKQIQEGKSMSYVLVSSLVGNNNHYLLTCRWFCSLHCIVLAAF